MDSAVKTKIDSLAADLQEAMEESWATRLILVALTRWLMQRGKLERADLPRLIEEAAQLMSYQRPSIEEMQLVQRMRGRLEAIGTLMRVTNTFPASLQ